MNGTIRLCTNRVKHDGTVARIRVPNLYTSVVRTTEHADGDQSQTARRGGGVKAHRVNIHVAGRILAAHGRTSPPGVQSACAVAGSSNYRKLESMEVTLSPEQQARLARLARERGTDAQALAREAIERLLATTIGSYCKSRRVWHRLTAAER